MPLQPLPATTKHSPLRILVVDPDTVARRRTCELVRGVADAVIEDVATADEALALALPGTAADLGLLVARVALPDATGLDLWRSVRDRCGRRGDVACVLIGDALGDDSAAAAIAAGADVVQAPVRAAELSARVRRALDDRSARATSATRQRRLSQRKRRLDRRRAELEQLVHVDGLTGVVNRRHLEQLVDLELRRAHRERADLAVIIVDVDYFHEYNEALGHLAGDDCLARIAGALASELRRPSDVVGRFGGDEFVVLLPRTDADGAARVAERLRAAIVRATIRHETSIGTVVTASLGVGVLSASGATSAGELLASADWSLLEAKRLGRNRFHGAEIAPPRAAPAPAPAPGEAWPPPVRVDPTMYGKLPDALERKRAEIDALAADDPRLLALASDLRRLGRELGFAVVARLGARLDRAVRAGDSRAVGRITSELRSYLERVPVIYLRA
jgi:diguanylate cyclase (GGDEF)-like protein